MLLYYSPNRACSIGVLAVKKREFHGCCEAGAESPPCVSCKDLYYILHSGIKIIQIMQGFIGCRKVVLILCKDLYYFLHSARSRSARFPGCLPPGSLRSFAGPKCQYFIRKMYIFSIRYCKMSLLHKENVYFQHSGLQNVIITMIAYIYIAYLDCIYRLHI